MSIWTCGPEDGFRLGRARDGSEPGRVNIPCDLNIAQIAIGWKHGHFFTEDNAFYSWGTGNSWGLGTGKKGNLEYPTKISTFPPDTRFRQVACGDKFSAVITDQGELYVWGAGYAHFPTLKELPSPAEFIACGQVTLLVTVLDGYVLEFHRKNETKAIRFEERISSVACGQNHRLALTESGEVYAWGSSAATGLLPSADRQPEKIVFNKKDTSIRAIFAYHNSSFFIDMKGKIWCCGANTSSCLGVGHSDEVPTPIMLDFDFNGEPIVQIACGDDFTLFLSSKGNVWASGNGADFRNATGSIELRAVPTPAIKLNGHFITQIAAGCFSSAFLEDGLPPFNRITKFCGNFKDFEIPPNPFRAQIDDVSCEVSPLNDKLRDFGFLLHDIIVLPNGLNAMIIGVSNYCPVAICEEDNSFIRIVSIDQVVIKSRKNAQLKERVLDSKILYIDESPSETLLISGFLSKDVIVTDGNEYIIIGAYKNCLYMEIPNKPETVRMFKPNVRDKVYRDGKPMHVLTVKNNEIFCVNPIDEESCIAYSSEYGFGRFIGSIGSSVFCYEFISPTKAYVLEKESLTIMRSANIRTQDYVTVEGDRISVNDTTSGPYHTLDRVLINNKDYGTFLGKYEDSYAVLLDEDRSGYCEVTLFPTNTNIEVMARIFGSCYKKIFLSNNTNIEISLNIQDYADQNFLPSDTISYNGREGVFYGASDGKFYAKFDNDKFVTEVTDKICLIRRNIDVLGITHQYNRDIDVSLFKCSIKNVIPGVTLKIFEREGKFVGFEPNTYNMLFKFSDSNELEFVDIEIVYQNCL